MPLAAASDFTAIPRWSMVVICVPFVRAFCHSSRELIATLLSATCRGSGCFDCAGTSLREVPARLSMTDFTSLCGRQSLLPEYTGRVGARRFRRRSGQRRRRAIAGVLLPAERRAAWRSDALPSSGYYAQAHDFRFADLLHNRGWQRLNPQFPALRWLRFLRWAGSSYRAAGPVTAGHESRARRARLLRDRSC